MMCFRIFDRYINIMNFFVRKMLYIVNLVFELIFIKLEGKLIFYDVMFLEIDKLMNE